MEAIDIGVTWTHLDLDIEGIERLSVWSDVA
jgi:hypothetical protein